MTPREKFVEAMQIINRKLTEFLGPGKEAWRRQAIEAFADAECPLEHDDMGPHDHAACRAALLRECGVGE